MNNCYELLKKMDGKEVKIYTHGEELLTHSHTNTKQFGQFDGHFGTGLQN